MRWEDGRYINQFFFFLAGGVGDNNYHSREQHDDGFHSNRGEEMASFYQHLHNSMANETAGCLLQKRICVICCRMFYGTISSF